MTLAKIPKCVVNEGEKMLYGATPRTYRAYREKATIHNSLGPPTIE